MKLENKIKKDSYRKMIAGQIFDDIDKTNEDQAKPKQIYITSLKRIEKLKRKWLE